MKYERYFCQKCGKVKKLGLSNFDFRAMMLYNPILLKKLLGDWHMKEDKVGVFRLYCPDCEN